MFNTSRSLLGKNRELKNQEKGQKLTKSSLKIQRFAIYSTEVLNDCKTFLIIPKSFLQNGLKVSNGPDLEL